MSRRNISTKPHQDNQDNQNITPDDVLDMIQDTRHFSLVRNFRLADVITLMNGVCGCLSIFASINHLILQSSNFDPSLEREILHLAFIFPFFGLIFDFLDGRVARWRKTATLLGQELDSLADLVSFGIAPAILAFSVGMREPLDVLILTSFVCCGITRLARFNATIASIPKDTTGKSKYFEGTPIPTTLGLVVILAFWESYGWTAKRIIPKITSSSSSNNYISNTPWISGSIFSRYMAGLFASNSLVIDNLPWGTFSLLGFKVHYATLLFGLSGAAMVSKTLKIPKL